MYLQDYAQRWLDKYPILKVRNWNSFERKINTGVHGKKFYIDVRNFYHNSTLSSSKAFIILHELMHAALVREDELFLPNLGMSTGDSFSVVGIPYWLNELSMYVYMKNIIKEYPANPIGGTLALGLPTDSYSFFAKAKTGSLTYDINMPEEWRGVSSEEIMMLKFSRTFTVLDFEEKLTKTLDFLTAVLAQIPEKKTVTTVKPPWPQYVRQPLPPSYFRPLRVPVSKARQTMKQRPR